MKPVCIEKTVFANTQKLFCRKSVCSRIIMARVGYVPQNVQTGSGTHTALRSNDTGVLYRGQSGRVVKLPTHLLPAPSLRLAEFIAYCRGTTLTCSSNINLSISRLNTSSILALLLTQLTFFWGGGRCKSPQWARASSFTRLLGHTQRRTAAGRPPLDEQSASCRDLYLTTHKTHNRQTSMHAVVFEPKINRPTP